MFGSLTTDRVEIPYKEGLLVFDHSYYLQCDDYEVEYEAKDAIKGKAIFDEFLQQHGIQKQETDKKIARFMKALQQQNS
ncbi:CYTH domain-containing protein [Lysinibacillus sp. MHQ-1]|nr:CYTH domain-containing protein [Lysinibacillus sp. MHQ-1]